MFSAQWEEGMTNKSAGFGLGNIPKKSIKVLVIIPSRNDVDD